MCHSCRILGDLYPGKLHETDYYLNKSNEQMLGNPDFVWLLSSQLCVRHHFLPQSSPKMRENISYKLMSSIKYDNQVTCVCVFLCVLNDLKNSTETN